MSAEIRTRGLREVIRSAEVRCRPRLLFESRSCCFPGGVRFDKYRLTCHAFRYFADNIRDDYANGALDGQVEGVLDEMKELSIYGP